MISKSISTFDNLLPTEDPAHLMNIVNECRKRPDAADLVDFSEERETLEALNIRLRGIIARYAEPADIDTAEADPRTLEQMDADEHAHQWRETYQSLLP